MKQIVLFAGIGLALIGAVYGLMGTSNLSDAPNPMGAVAVGICALALVLAADRF